MFARTVFKGGIVPHLAKSTTKVYCDTTFPPAPLAPSLRAKSRLNTFHNTDNSTYIIRVLYHIHTPKHGGEKTFKHKHMKKDLKGKKMYVNIHIYLQIRLMNKLAQKKGDEFFVPGQAASVVGV
jgi:hypothetical protein